MTVAEAGRRGGLTKWAGHVGPVRPYIGDIQPERRRVILALIEAERHAQEREQRAQATA